MNESRIIPLIALLLLFGTTIYDGVASSKSAAPAAAPTTSVATNDSVNGAPLTNSATTNQVSEPMATNISAAVVAPETAPVATNPPVVEVATNSMDATNTPAATPEIKPVVKVVEMPATVPVAPTSFYPVAIATNSGCMADVSTDYYFTARAGYEHTGYGNDRDTWYAGIKFYAHPEKLRANAGKNAWLIPDADAEFSHQYLAKPDKATKPGAGEGVQLRATFFWPWLNWTTRVLTRENCACYFAQPITFALGPTFNAGFEKTFEGSAFRFTRYGGARLTINRYAFFEYTFGNTDGLDHWRQQILGELPFYVSRDGQVRYVARGEWSRGDRNLPDFYQAGVFVEMPLGLLAHPCQWGDLIPFAK